MTDDYVSSIINLFCIKRLMNERYQIEEEGTSGWFIVDDKFNLTKEQAKESYNLLVLEGYNPNRLKIVRTK